MTYLPETFTAIYSRDNFIVEVDSSNGVLRINGVQYAFEIFEMLANPDPAKRYSFERDGDMVIVHEKMAVAEISMVTNDLNSEG